MLPMCSDMTEPPLGVPYNARAWPPQAAQSLTIPVQHRTCVAFARPPGQSFRMLLDDIKARMFKAMKAGDVLEKEILRVAVGEITTEAAREGRKGSDEEAQAILRKLVKSNEETLTSL